MLPILVDISVIVLTILLNAFYVAAEFSLARCKHTKIHALLGTGKLAPRLLDQAIKNLNDYISAAQVGITLATIVLGIFAESMIAKLLDPFLHTLDIPEPLLHPISTGLATLVAACPHVVFGEFIPKTLALQYAEPVALATIIPLHWSYKLTYPLVAILNSFSNMCLRIAGLPFNNKPVFAYTEEEIKILLKESKAEGIIEQREEEMFNKVFEFTDTVVREIMTPRIEIIGVESGASLNEAVQIVIEHKTSKLPVYEESVDNIKGYIHSTDLLKVLSESEQDITVVDELIRPIMKVPESKPIADLLAEFKRDRVQIAIVLDEFGGTDGLVTLEDIVEELVGDIQDEDELPEEPIVEVEDGGYLIESRVPISEVNESLETRLSEEHFDTIGGYVFGLIGREPRIGDEVEDLDWTFKVEKLDEHNIKQIKAIPNINNSSDELSEETNNINGAIET